ncbi:MAG: cytochrome C [Actinobacteria bacterium]|nr:cytochrome C [Actinomycetota bacterium]
MSRMMMSWMIIAAFVMMVTAVPVYAGEAVTYEKDIKGIIAKRCIACHGSVSPTMEEFDRDKEGFKKKMKGPRYDTYANLMVVVKGSDAGALMRRLDDGKNTKDGKPGNMHNYLGSTDAERSANLEIFRKWVGNWTLKRKKELGKKELEAIRAPEK